ncbi:MAG: TIGR02679 family protein [Streptosporangiaceae bacterium]
MSLPARQIVVDPAKLQRMLGSPELSWLVDRIRSRLERGEPIDGTVTLVGATPGQRRAAARLIGRSVGRGTSLSIPLPAVATELWRAAAAPDLVSAVEAIGGPVRNLAAERAADLQRWGDALTEVRASRLSRHAWYRDWLDAISRDGTVTRLIRQGQAHVIGQAVAVLELLPIGSEAGTAVLATLAAGATGNDRALSEGPLAQLVLRALATREGVAAPVGREAEQALWSAAGVVADDLASQVLVLNLRSGGEPVGRWLTEAANSSQPFRLTLRQIIAAPVLPWALDIFVCSSTALMSAAADQLAVACPALVCTEGEPSVACIRLLESAVSSGSAVRWHADFSWPGLRGTAAAIRRLRAEPWRMAASDYQAALAGGADPLKGRAEPSPWDPRLGELMRMTGRAVYEERVLPGLLAELAARAEPGLPLAGAG